MRAVRVWGRGVPRAPLAVFQTSSLEVQFFIVKTKERLKNRVLFPGNQWSSFATSIGKPGCQGIHSWHLPGCNSLGEAALLLLKRAHQLKGPLGRNGAVAASLVPGHLGSQEQKRPGLCLGDRTSPSKGPPHRLFPPGPWVGCESPKPGGGLPRRGLRGPLPGSPSSQGAPGGRWGVGRPVEAADGRGRSGRAQGRNRSCRRSQSLSPARQAGWSGTCARERPRCPPPLPSQELAGASGKPGEGVQRGHPAALPGADARGGRGVGHTEPGAHRVLAPKARAAARTEGSAAAPRPESGVAAPFALLAGWVAGWVASGAHPRARSAGARRGQSVGAPTLQAALGQEGTPPRAWGSLPGWQSGKPAARRARPDCRKVRPTLPARGAGWSAECPLTKALPATPVAHHGCGRSPRAASGDAHTALQPRGRESRMTPSREAGKVGPPLFQAWAGGCAPSRMRTWVRRNRGPPASRSGSFPPPPAPAQVLFWSLVVNERTQFSAPSPSPWTKKPPTRSQRGARH